ncbi:CLUMA_CG013290, isoform A [Clunio marinus]|uniref:CLUMA_CG013290, isoform A n=1 Tax=Clunio marinus TaxID=568069 RepID=A0A1J1IIH2_9DIPT|nr:CLUMA_CG013290, isoform A [Clunio marinus]
MGETVVNMGHYPNGQPNGNAGAENLSWIKFNVDYFKNRDGLLKLFQLFIAIICMALASPAYKGVSHFFLFVVIINFIGTVLWSFVYFLGIKDVLFLPINWILSEFVNVVIATMLYAAAFIMQMATWVGSNERNAGANTIAGFFGLVNCLAYASSSYYLYLQYKFDNSN